jgi:hypothetical protein
MELIIVEVQSELLDCEQYFYMSLFSVSWVAKPTVQEAAIAKHCQQSQTC